MPRGPKPKSATKGRIVQVGLRITDGLRAKLEKEARLNARSLNAEMEWRLEKSFDPMVPREEVTDFLRLLVQDMAKREKDKEKK